MKPAIENDMPGWRAVIAAHGKEARERARRAPKPKKSPALYVVACANGAPHGTAEAKVERQVAAGDRDYLDKHGYDCGPHRVVAYVPRERRQGK